MKIRALVAGLATTATALVPTLAEASAFPGTNGVVAYTALIDGQSDICVVEPDGTNPRILVGTPAHEGTAAWSPDGSKLAYTDFDENRAGRIKVLDLATGTTTDLGEGNEPAWSPSGDQLAFAAAGIWVMDADGSDRRRVDSGDSSTPAWSPDGTKIAFFDDIRDNTVDEGDIWMTTPDGAPAENISDGGPASWSPDGTQLVADGGYWGLAIYVMDADGNNQRTLVESEEPLREVLTGSTWSPDGTTIAYSRSQALAQRNVTDIWTVPAAGGEPSRLMATPNPEFDPDWQPVMESTPQVTGGQPCSVSLPERTVTLRLRGHLTAVGRVSSASDPDCASAWVRVRRTRAGRSKWVSEEPTDAEGRFQIRVPDRTGRYRAVAIGDGQCDVGRSTTRLHRH